MPKLLVIEVAGLGWNLVERYGALKLGSGLELQPLKPCFPAVTCTAQATFRTAAPAARHGIVCNGRFDRRTCKTDFWNQSAGLVDGARIWAGARAAGHRVGVLFWQQSLGEQADLILSPAPIHKHHGGMIQDCYGQPPSLYAGLCAAAGRPFNLMHYWGPLASVRGSQWITTATCAVLTDPALAPDLLLTYLPHLDYVLQRYGPDDERAVRPALRETAAMLATIVQAARATGHEVLVWGDYAITPAAQVVYPNRRLRDAGLFQARAVGRRTYPDLYASRAFAMVDHQVAHVYVRESGDLAAVRECLAGTAGVESVEPAGPELAHAEAGDLILTAAPGAWFAYPWWEDRAEAPDYATHVDIHSKIGFDPCELFWGWPPPAVSQDARRVRGTHGRNDAPTGAAASTRALHGAADLIDLARRVQTFLAGAA